MSHPGLKTSDGFPIPRREKSQNPIVAPKALIFYPVPPASFPTAPHSALRPHEFFVVPWVPQAQMLKALAPQDLWLGVSST